MERYSCSHVTYTKEPTNGEGGKKMVTSTPLLIFALQYRPTLQPGQGYAAKRDWKGRAGMEDGSAGSSDGGENRVVSGRGLDSDVEKKVYIHCHYGK